MSLLVIPPNATAYDIWAVINEMDGPPLCRFCEQPIETDAPVEDFRYPGYSHAMCLNAHLETP